MDAVLLDNVTKSFGQVRAVDGLDVQVPAGSIYGFLGPNGAGKTTTIRMIMNIIRPDSGRIKVFSDGATTQAKTRIGYMPEERGLYRKMTVAKVLAYFGAIKGVPADQLNRRVPEWLKRVELDNWANKKVEELSRGMHQKLQFAVTAINDPELLILDEPFSGLDPVNQDLLKDIILDMRNHGKTVIFSTHVMHEAEKLCDFIILINKGKLVVNGTLEQIRSQWKSHAVCIKAEGDTSFLERLPIVAAVNSQGDRLEIDLEENADPQQLLKALVERVKVQNFEIKSPSLHEIFVKLVRTSNAQNS
ncbi:MAG: ABC transporter ATP-binding protein [Planctomycetota bacterium]|jgi:ABC-2 type transport system ATP-binding protein